MYDYEAHSRNYEFKPLPEERMPSGNVTLEHAPEWPKDDQTRSSLRAEVYGRFRRYEVEELRLATGPDESVDGLSPPYLYGLHPFKGDLHVQRE
jgi:hypothetical protein